MTQHTAFQTLHTPGTLWYVHMRVGHNVGSPHTHSCNWVADPAYGFTGGGIDDCGVSSGLKCLYSCCSCSSGGFGTIMSYCHVGGSGIV